MTEGVMNTSASPNNRILMVVRDDSRDLDLMLRHEVFVMRDVIASAGYTIDIVTVTDRPLTGESASLSPDLTLASVEISDYRGLMLPCMAPVPGDVMPDNIVRMIECALKHGVAIGAMRGSVREVARAGGLRGHRYSYASQTDPIKQPEFAEAVYVGTGVTRDRMIATAGVCPLAAQKSGEVDGTTALTRAFLDILETDRAEPDDKKADG